jgi:hypothetical protein
MPGKTLQLARSIVSIDTFHRHDFNVEFKRASDRFHAQNGFGDRHPAKRFLRGKARCWSSYPGE